VKILNSFLGVLICANTVFSVKALYAQDLLSPAKQRSGFFIGLIGGVGETAHQMSLFPVPEFTSWGVLAGNAVGLSQFWGVGAAIPLSASIRDFLTLEAMLDIRDGDFYFTNGSMLPDVDTVSIGGMSVLLRYLTFDLGLKHNFASGPTPHGLAMQLSISTNLKLKNDFRKVLIHHSPGGSGQEVIIQPVEDARPFRLAIRPELLYDIPLWNNFIFTPRVGFDSPLTEVARSRSWTTSVAFGGFSILYWLH
jgi:hypothetical protein